MVSTQLLAGLKGKQSRFHPSRSLVWAMRSGRYHAPCHGIHPRSRVGNRLHNGFAPDVSS
eukprot:959189-Pyramimonas_sp.AAC.1